MFLGVHGASWRLLLPNNTQGLLHVSCMSKFSSHSTEGEESVHPEFPTHPGKSIWLTCRIIDQATSLPEHGADEEDLDKSIGVVDQKKAEDAPQIARGDEVIPVGGDDEDDVPKVPTKIFYVSTEASDIRKWNSEKYSKNLELILNQPMMGIIKCRFRKTLIVNLNYKTEVVIPYSTPLKPDKKVGAPVKVILTSLEPLEGCLAEPPIRRKRSMSISAAVPGSELGPSPKKRRRSISVHLPEEKSLPNITDMFARYADFLPLLRNAKKEEEEKKKAKLIHHPENEKVHDQNVEMADISEKAKNLGEFVWEDDRIDMMNTIGHIKFKNCMLMLFLLPIVDNQPSTHLTTVMNEARLAEIAKATSSAGQDASAKIPRMTTVEEFEVAVRNAPQNARLWSLYAAHYQAAGDLNRARVVLRRALNSPTASNLGSEEFVSNLLLASLRLESTAALSVGVSQVNEEGKKNLDEVIRRIEQIDKGDLVSKAVSLLSNVGLHERADALAKKFVKGHSLVSEAWLNLVRARFRAGNVVGAREAQRNAGQILNMSQVPQFALGCAQLEYAFGDFDRAVKLMEEQIAVHPQRKSLYTSYIRLLLQAAKRKEAE
ncbi:unnamed protein product [Hymenolepis diminuta]|uniref:TPR_REGION domain-containing protein n=1 Tax=Hymenolepis diminuta TaxID=6216 RepID=A0A0R3S9K6_HYMDI|nr:unnamed protein product [Hymenolepis diminuta]